jgi:elongator complex protein 5
MSISALSIDRNHKRRLLQNVINQKDNASPLTLILDSLEQSAQPLVQEFMRAAKVVSQDSYSASSVKKQTLIHPQIRRAKIIFVSFATVKKPPLADVFIKGRGKSLEALSK